MFYTRRNVCFAGLASLALCLSGCFGTTTKVVLKNDSTSTATLTAANLSAGPVSLVLSGIMVAPGKSVTVSLPVPSGNTYSVSSLITDWILSNSTPLYSQTITVSGSIVTGKTNTIDIIAIDNGTSLTTATGTITTN